MKKKFLMVILTGVVAGAAAILLTRMGNPANMGFCIACFLRDIAGAAHLHGAEATRYIRPEIIGLVIGAFAMALVSREFKPAGGSSPMTRFLIAMFVMVGALVFLGCPLRIILRLGGGDLNALVGLVGFAAGIGVGILALNKGFTLKRAYAQTMVEGSVLPAIMLVLLAFSLLAPALFAASESGPGSMHAPVWISLICAVSLGALAQRSRLCTVAGIRDSVMFNDFTLLAGFAAIFVTVLVGNLILGNFKLGFADQPVAHTDGIWNFLGMALTGWGSVLLGGCPLRQLVLSGQGNSDSAVTVAGYIVGAALCHNFALASSAKGPTPGGQIATLVGFAVLAVISLMNISKTAKE